MHRCLAMQALFVRFKQAVTPAGVDELFRPGVGGLLQSLYVRDPVTREVGGIYVFDSSTSLDAFTRSDLARSIADAYRPIAPASRRILDLALHPLQPATDDRQRAVLDRLIEGGFQAGDLAALDELFAPGFVEHRGRAPAGVAGMKAFIRNLRTALPDLELALHEVVSSGDRLWTRMTIRGTQRGRLLGAPPTGMPIELAAFDLYRFDDGRIAEHWGVLDRSG